VAVGPVEVRAARRGLTVRAPAAFLAPPRPADPIAASPSPRLPALARRTSRLIRPWYGVARGEDGRMRVRFVWEPAADRRGGRRSQLPARVAMKATDADGAALFEGSVAPVSAAASQTPHAVAVFEAPPGRVQLQLSIEDAAARQLDTDVRELAVAALDGPLAFGTPEVFRARTARTFRALASSLDAVPVASREFSRAERLLVRVPVYAEGDGPRLSARLSSRLGGPMRDLAFAPGPAPELYQVDLPLAGLAVGDYAIDLTATSPAGSVTERVAFRLIP
jgi:hypothetical protein